MASSSKGTVTRRLPHPTPLPAASSSNDADSDDSSKLDRNIRRKQMIAVFGSVFLFFILMNAVPLVLTGDRATQQVEFHTAIQLDDDNKNTEMPRWMRDYFRWHAQQRRKLTAGSNEWKSMKFLLMQCLPNSRKCGGTADRLKPLPVMLLMAHKSRRLLLIKWGRPAELEAFLQPPQGGMDWRVPDWLHQQQEFRQGPRATNIEELIELTTNSEEFPMVKARVQAHDHGSVYYNEQRQQPDEPTFEQVYHLCWRVLFTPAHAVAKRIEQQVQTSGMVPGHYVGIHIRAMYGVSERDPAMIEHWTRNAIHCASQLEKQQLHSTAGPFYLSSDSSVALAVGMAYGMELGAQVVTRQTAEEKAPKQPYHLDKAPKSAKPSEFYDTFVDLYLLAMGRCVTYNMGGYGTWALYISPYTNHNNQSCSFQHHNASGIHKCEWAGARNPSKAMTKQQQTTIPNKALFLPPMK